MYPVLFHIGPVNVYSFGLMLSLAFALAVLVAFFNARNHGVDRWLMIDMALWMFLAGLVGARLVFVLLNWSYYAANPVEVFATWEGGVSFYGAILGGFLVVVAFARRRRLQLGPVADAIAPGVALAASVGRLGCALNGCCYGLPTSGLWGVFTRFAPGLRHPTQLYESTLYLLSFLFLLGWQKKHAKVPGQLFLTFVGLYLAGRFAVEFLREGERIYSWLTVTQAASLVIAPVVLLAYVYLDWRAKTAAAAAPGPSEMTSPAADTPAAGQALPGAPSAAAEQSPSGPDTAGKSSGPAAPGA